MTRARSYKADYDGKQGEPYVRAKGKCKSQLDFASRFDIVRSKFPSISCPSSSNCLHPSQPRIGIASVILSAAMTAASCLRIRKCSRTTIANAMYASLQPQFSPHASRPHAAQVDDVQRFGDKGTFFTSHDILDHGHRRKPQTFDG